ncbi:hypothetical protein C799_04217 [Bacteroides thetaiotaomicron dnLKV9]|uniref:Uncharacterized protein n=1 Tax=Bacteroides thetaiotaomicron dnLKV9 TaxID=1235785 RepID=R9HA24_BACT4|nr:hypothetical protein [Bacteroides thetaiotaomicron]EOR98004.1 hypothetical protein C799_04217 [Bacteroides thetaiotaomicron dnLKV9]
MKKKIQPIKLHNLNRFEMESKEQNLLRGGSGTKCGCVAVCSDAICSCTELGDSGTFPDSNRTAIVHQSSTRLTMKTMLDQSVRQNSNANT